MGSGYFGPIAASLFAAVFLLPAALLFVPFRIRTVVSVFLPEGQPALAFRIGFRLGLLRLRLHYRLQPLPDGRLRLLNERRGKLVPVKKKTPAQKQKQRHIIAALLPRLSFRGIALTGRIGVTEDAALCCFLCGALESFITALLGAALIAFPPAHAELAPSACGGVRPDFSKNAFRLALRCMIGFIPAKLFKNLLCALHEEKKKDKQNKERNYAPDRKHYADLHGADKAHGGC
ncbi:MAG: hypothetical protein J5544_02010 [Clostridia bacterium]|nr:hypothetical protein [Clostridia bacterium]